jgi:hypothetical protein
MGLLVLLLGGAALAAEWRAHARARGAARAASTE